MSGCIVCVTWNVAAINNNPFEYWVTADEPAYGRLLEDVQQFIDMPTQDQDVLVSTVFTDELFEELAAAMTAERWTGVDETRVVWQNVYSKRRIISGFLKDKGIGSKRLASMPDRLTNSIHLANGTYACRPCIISNSLEPLCDIKSWWRKWKAFMFDEEFEVLPEEGEVRVLKPCHLLTKIKRTKYPAITEEEEAISVPLQALCCAIFDAVLVHMLNTVAPGTWLEVKRSLCLALASNKVPQTLSILEKQYGDVDVIFLQECASTFRWALRSSNILSSNFVLLFPSDHDASRDQNSLVLVSRRSFRGALAKEITAECIEHVEGVCIAPGDLYAAIVPPAASDPDQTPYMLVSFHGDTDGHMTLPVLDAVLATRSSLKGATCRLIFGLDANAYCRGMEGQYLSSAQFAVACAARGLTECWQGLAARAPQQCCTTFNARTYLQPQLNKAVSRKAARHDPNTDRNPKDYIVVDDTQFRPDGLPERDNTGTRGIFLNDAPFPTLRFPSDHAVLLSRMCPVTPPKVDKF